jgi:hypothetical protein
VAGGGGSGTVTSVALSGGTTGLTVTGSPITTTGTITLAGTLAVANGGTNATTAADARTNLGLVIGTDVLSPSGSAASLTSFPTFNQNTTGTAAGLSATLVATSGGTGQSSYAVGDLLYASTTTALSKLSDVATGNALISGGVGVAPSWGKVGLATHVSGTLPTANGGTNLTSFTSGGVVYASSTSALATGSALVFDGSNLGIGTTTPSKKLSVNGAADVAAGTGYFRVQTSIGDSHGIQFNYNNLGTGVGHISNSFGSGGLAFGGGNSSEHMRLDSSGSLLIATTTAPTAGGFPRSPLSIKQINDSASFSGIQIEASAEQSVLGIGYNGTTFQFGTSYRGTGGYKDISFNGAGTEAVRIDTSGNLGVGTTSPSSKLSVAGNITLLTASPTISTALNDNFDIKATNAGGQVRIFSGNSLAIECNSAQAITLPNLAGTGTRAVNANASGTLSAASDSRLKQEVEGQILPSLAEVMKLEVKAYKWLDDINVRGADAAVEIGFFADQVAPIIPSAAPMGRDGYYGFYDRSVIAALVNAIKEQQALITQLTTRITALESA